MDATREFEKWRDRVGEFVGDLERLTLKKKGSGLSR